MVTIKCLAMKEFPSFENVPQVETSRKETEIDYDEMIQEMIDTLPQELAEIWEDRFAECNNADDLKSLHDKLCEVVEKRNRPSSLSHFDSMLFEGDEINKAEREIIRNELSKKVRNPEMSIGKGKVAEVFKINGTCCKCVHDIGLHQEQNTLFQEADIQRSAMDIDPNGPVRIPSPYYCELVDGQPALVMERIKGMTLGEIAEKRKLPEGFDPESFFNALIEFIEKKMNAIGIHHRDIHAGNIMLEWETMKPVIIDFGLAKVGMSGYFDDDYRYWDPIEKRETILSKDNEAIRNIRADYLPILKGIIDKKG